MPSIKTTHTLISLACVMLLASCGGGGGGSSDSAASPSPSPVLLGTSVVSGTVTGFGSVIVNGTRIDDRVAPAGRELENGDIRQVELKLGQHVEVAHDGKLVASRVRVESEVEGAVTALNVANATLTILGQTVLINSDPALGPVTVFGAPYTQLADIKPADQVEIHGLIKIDAAGKVTVQATRIDARGAEDADRVNGLVSDLSVSAKTFTVGTLKINYTDAKLLPAGVVLANGMPVHVSIPLAAARDGATVKAVVVKVKDRKAESEGHNVELGGAISTIDAAAKTIKVNGVTVDMSAVTFNQPGRSTADLTPGSYVVIKGAYVTGGTLKASTIVLRGRKATAGSAKQDDQENEVELHGTILNYQSPSNFTIRGIMVDATGAVIDASCGAGAKLANDLQVSATGSLTSTGKVMLTSVKCEKAEDGISTVEREGVAGRVDTGTLRFSLTTAGSILPVAYDARTLFVDVTAATIEGKSVRVEGVLDGSVLRASKIKARK